MKRPAHKIGMTMNGNLIYIVTETSLYRSGHTTMTGPEQFINWIKTEIIHYNRFDGQIVDAAHRLIEILNRQIAGEPMHQLVINAANELDLRVTVVTGTILADWN